MDKNDRLRYEFGLLILAITFHHSQRIQCHARHIQSYEIGKKPPYPYLSNPSRTSHTLKTPTTRE